MGKPDTVGNNTVWKIQFEQIQCGEIHLGFHTPQEAYHPKPMSLTSDMTMMSVIIMLNMFWKVTLLVTTRGQCNSWCFAR